MLVELPDDRRRWPSRELEAAAGGRDDLGGRLPPGAAQRARRRKWPSRAGDDGQWTMVGKDYQNRRFSATGQHHRRQRRAAEGRLDVLDRHPERARRRAAVVGRHDVRRHAVSQRRLRLRPAQSRRPAEVDLQAAAVGGGAGRRLLRRREPRRGVLERTSSSTTCSTRRRSPSTPPTGTRGLEDEARRHQQRRDDHDGAARREGEGAGRQQRRRVRRARLAGRAGRRHRQARLARLQHRPRRRLPDRRRASTRSMRRIAARTWAFTPGRPSSGRLGGGTVVGLRLLRPGAGPRLLRHRQPGRLEPRHAARRQQVVGRHVRAPSRQPGRRSGSTSGARTICTTTTASTRTCWSISTIKGKPRQVLAHADRNGYFYLLDRATGEVLSATPFAHVNSSHGVDLQTGRLIPAGEKKPQQGRVVRDVCPAAPGAKDWQPMAFSPQTGWFYIPHNNMCEDIETTEASYIAGTPYVGANVRYKPGRAATAASSPPGIRWRRKPVWTHQGELSGLERRAGDRRRAGLLRKHGRLVQGARRPHRQAAVAVPDRLGRHRPADHLPRARRQAVRRRLLGRGRLGGRASSGPTSTRATRRPATAGASMMK